MNVFHFISLILMGIARPGQISENNKFAKAFQYLKKELSYDVDVSTHMINLLQIDNIFSDGFSHACPSYPDKSTISFVTSEEKSAMKLGTYIFLDIKCFPTIDPFFL